MGATLGLKETEARIKRREEGTEGQRARGQRPRVAMRSHVGGGRVEEGKETEGAARRGLRRDRDRTRLCWGREASNDEERWASPLLGPEGESVEA